MLSWVDSENRTNVTPHFPLTKRTRKDSDGWIPVHKRHNLPLHLTRSSCFPLFTKTSHAESKFTSWSIHRPC